ncbi:hypothetical protein JCM3766R1_005100 [Sporobolomyces carnicolor]
MPRGRSIKRAASSDNETPEAKRRRSIPRAASGRFCEPPEPPGAPVKGKTSGLSTASSSRARASDGIEVRTPTPRVGEHRPPRFDTFEPPLKQEDNAERRVAGRNDDSVGAPEFTGENFSYKQILAYFMVDMPPGQPPRTEKTKVAIRTFRNSADQSVICNRDLATYLALFFDLPLNYYDAMSLRLRSMPAWQVRQAIVPARPREDAIKLFLEADEAVSTPPLHTLPSFQQKPDPSQREAALHDPTRCFVFPESEQDCLVVRFRSMKQHRLLASSTNPSPPVVLPPPPPPSTTEDVRHPTPVPSPPPTKAALVQPAIVTENRPVDPADPTPSALSFDFERPWGTWPEHRSPPPNFTKPVWALLNAGGGKKRRLPWQRKRITRSSSADVAARSFPYKKDWNA